MNKKQTLEDEMNEAQQAWALWHLLQNLSETLWDKYSNEFLDFYMEQDKDNQYCGSSKKDLPDNGMPF